MLSLMPPCCACQLSLLALPVPRFSSFSLLHLVCPFSVLFKLPQNHGPSCAWRWDVTGTIFRVWHQGTERFLMRVASGHPQTLNPEEQPLLHVSCRQISHQPFRGDARTASSTEKSFAENKLKVSKPKMNYLNRTISFRSFFFPLLKLIFCPYLVHVNFYFQTLI